MPLYRFRVMPPDGDEDAVVSLPNDEAAFKEAMRALGDMVQDALTEERAMQNTIIVLREDGEILKEVKLRVD